MLKGTISKCINCGQDVEFDGFAWRHTKSYSGLPKAHQPKPTLAEMRDEKVDTEPTAVKKKKSPVCHHITRKFEFDSAHRVYGHAGKCRNLHGHRYVAEITISGSELPASGMLVDFGTLKDIIGEWIDTVLDHNVLLWKKDPLVPLLKQDTHSKKKPLLLSHNPTAEVLAVFLFDNVHALLFSNHFNTVTVTHVRLWETPSCHVDYYGTGTLPREELEMEIIPSGGPIAD